MDVRRALISVYDKTGVAEFARALHEELGIEIVSTGGTAKALEQAGVPVTLVEHVASFPEMLDGRVKTLHPAIHAAILADRDNPDHMRQLEAAGIKPIDMVVVNLYPFEATVADPNCTFERAIEMIDIGGVALLRAAAKNHRHVFVLRTETDLGGALAYLRGRVTGWDEASFAKWRAERAWETFWHVSRYDACVARWLATHPAVQPFTMDLLSLHLEGSDPLRYGENPHQAATVFDLGEELSPLSCRPPVSENPPMSYNNYLDADAALELCAEVARAPHALIASAPAAQTPYACAFIKHTNACGVGLAHAAELSIEAQQAARIEAYRRAYLGDPNAAMGGALAVNFTVDAEFAALVMETFDRFGRPLKERGAAHAPGGFFVELWIAPRFTDDAVAIIRGTYHPNTATPAREGGCEIQGCCEPPIELPPRRKWGDNVRLLRVGDLTQPPDPAELRYRSVAGAMLVQSADRVGLNEDAWRLVTKRAPTAAELADLRLAWLIAKHTRSNAISLVRDGMLIGNGAGQMSRVMSCRVATWLAQENGHLRKEPGDGATGNHGQGAGGPDGAPVAASDAFFPFPDGPLILIDAGVKAIIQPGGSKRDAESIDLCDRRDVAMIFTGTRHFRH